MPFEESAQVFRAKRLQSTCGALSQSAPWTFPALVGQLSELSEEEPAGAVSVAAGLIREAQTQGQIVAWIAGCGSIFYPPDFAECGVDLGGVMVVWAPGAIQSLLAADQLLRSGAFGLLVVDLGTDWRVGEGPLGRIARLAEIHAAAVLFLTMKLREAHSLGSMVTLRGVTAIEPHSSHSISIRTVRNKHDTTGAVLRKAFHAPPGMR